MIQEQGMILNNIATIHTTKGNFQQALDLYTKSLDIAEKIEDVENIAINLANMGDIYRLRGENGLIDILMKTPWKILKRAWKYLSNLVKLHFLNLQLF